MQNKKKKNCEVNRQGAEIDISAGIQAMGALCYSLLFFSNLKEIRKSTRNLKLHIS